MESVAWISERKDVLSAFLLTLALLLYVLYVEKPLPSDICECYGIRTESVAKPWR